MFPTATFPADTSTEVAKAVFGLAQALFSPDAVVHLGAGTGQGPLHQWRQWQVPQSLVVDAQGGRMAWVKDWAAQSPGRYSKVVTIGAEGPKASFNVASNPNESGLIDPENLTGLWSNLKRVESIAAECVGLDSLLAQADVAELQTSKTLWLLVDFFCPAAFWAGANDTLSKTSVLVLRQSKAGLVGVESRSDCDKRLQTRGFMRAADLESNHPQVVHSVYFRNLTTGIQLALAQRDQETKAKAELAGKLEEEGKARAALQQEKAVLLQEKTALTQDKAALEKEKAALTQEAAALKTAQATETQAKEQALAQRDQETKAKAELAGKLEEESKARAALQQEKAVLLQEKTALTQDKAALEKEKAALTQETAALEQQKSKITKEAVTLKESIDLQTKETASIQLRCRDLESTNSDLEARQQLMHEELVKAEAQIELIKDLILRETGL